jgi:hypothetical protein
LYGFHFTNWQRLELAKTRRGASVMEAMASEAKLLEAVRAGNVEHVQELIKSHPDAVHAADPHGWCPLPPPHHALRMDK